MNDYAHIEEQIAAYRKRYPLAPEGNMADNMQSMLEVVRNAQRFADDPSWKAHRRNLQTSLAKLKE